MKNLLASVLLASASLLASCGGGGSSGGAAGSLISGSVQAPGGNYALGYQPNVFAKIINWLIPSAVATTNGVFASVGSGVKVQLVNLDPSGNVTGSPLANGVTAADGSFNMQATQSITPSANMAVQVLDASGNVVMSTFLSSLTGATVNPITTAVTGLVKASAQSQSISVGNVNVLSVSCLVNTMASNLGSPDYANASTNSINSAVTALNAIATKNEELSNQVSSISANGVVSGIVKDSKGVGVQGVTVVIADYGNWVVRGCTQTDSNGAYSINAPTNKTYIIGAFTKNLGSKLASQWWTSGGGVINAFSAESLQLSATTTTRNFTLQDGTLISGNVSPVNSSSGLSGILVKFWDFYSVEYDAKVTSASDGSFSIGMPNGKYLISAENATVQPFASGWWVNNSSSGLSNTYLQGGALNVDGSSSSVNVNLSLSAGYPIKGVVKDNSGSNVTGQVIRIYDGNPDSSTFANLVAAFRTDMTGNYFANLPILGNTPPAQGNNPPFYAVRVRGQTKLLAFDAVSASQSPTRSTDFTDSVQVIRGFVKDSDGNPVPQAKVVVSTYGGSTTPAVNTNDTSVTLSPDNRYLGSSKVGFDCISATNNVNRFNPCYVGLEVSNADGSFEVYSGIDSAAKVILFARLDNGSTTGSVYYNGGAQNASPATRIGQAQTISVSTSASAVSLPNPIYMPKNGMTLTGTMTLPSGSPAVAYLLQLRPVVSGESFSCMAFANVIGQDCGYYTHGYTATISRSDGSYSISVPAGAYYLRLSTAQSSYFSSFWKYSWLTSSTPVSNQPSGNLGVQITPSTCANCVFDWSGATGTQTLNITVPTGM